MRTKLDEYIADNRSTMFTGSHVRFARNIRRKRPLPNLTDMFAAYPAIDEVKRNKSLVIYCIE